MPIQEHAGSGNTGYRGSLPRYGAVSRSMGGRGAAAGLGAGGDLGGRALARRSLGFGATGPAWENELRSAARQLGSVAGPSSQVLLLGPADDRIVGVLFSATEIGHDRTKHEAERMAERKGFEVVSVRQAPRRRSFIGFMLPGSKGNVESYLTELLKHPSRFGAAPVESGDHEAPIDVEVRTGAHSLSYSGDTLGLAMLMGFSMLATIQQARAR